MWGVGLRSARLCARGVLVLELLEFVELRGAPNETQTCLCGVDVEGIQTCQADGSWTTCSCDGDVGVGDAGDVGDADADVDAGCGQLIPNDDVESRRCSMTPRKTQTIR